MGGDKPSVLVLGGCGFVGRNLVAMLVDRELCSHIRVVDLTMPAMAFLAPAHQAAFDSPLVEYKQGDLSRDAAVAKAFEGAKFEYVFNLTYDGVPFGQTDEVYEQRILSVSAKLGAAAAAAGVRRFVDLSTAQVYEPSDKASGELGKLKPWTKQATYKLRAEEALRQIRGLPLVVLRAANIYGPADTQGLTPRLICAAAYVQLGEKMRFLWDSSLRMHTVHVADVAAALWHVAAADECGGHVYNLADSSGTTQGSVAAALERLFGIKTGFLGTIASTAVKTVGLKSFAETANEKHMGPWADMCKAAGILNTPLTPYIDADLLGHTHLAVDGSAICATGFRYAVPQLTADTLRAQVEMYVAQQLFPATALRK